MAEQKLWIWIRIPLRALHAAIDALKERAMARHAQELRSQADEDDARAEELKAALRGVEDPPAELRWPGNKGDR